MLWIYIENCSILAQNLKSQQSILVKNQKSTIYFGEKSKVSNLFW
jgi:hypothetical protein